MNETWTTRDLPVLIAAAEHLERTLGQPAQPHQLARDIGMDVREVTAGLMALTPTYLVTSREDAAAGPPEPILRNITDEGRRAAGLWPARADHLSALIAALESAIAAMTDTDERTRLEKLRDAVKGAPQRVTESVVAGVIAGQIGG